MKAVLHVGWIVFKVSVVFASAIGCFVAVLLIGLDRYFQVFTLGALLALAILLAWAVGPRATLMVLGAWPVLLIRYFPVVILALLFVPIFLGALAVLAPLILFQAAIYRALD